jgi:hypothetical protein
MSKRLAAKKATLAFELDLNTIEGGREGAREGWMDGCRCFRGQFGVHVGVIFHLGLSYKGQTVDVPSCPCFMRQTSYKSCCCVLFVSGKRHTRNENEDICGGGGGGGGGGQIFSC